jgi:hypothetical protein
MMYALIPRGSRVDLHSFAQAHDKPARPKAHRAQRKSPSNHLVRIKAARLLSMVLDHRAACRDSDRRGWN